MPISLFLPSKSLYIISPSIDSRNERKIRDLEGQFVVLPGQFGPQRVGKEQPQWDVTRYSNQDRTSNRLLEESHDESSLTGEHQMHDMSIIRPSRISSTPRQVRSLEV